MLASPFPSSVSKGEQDVQPQHVFILLPTGCSPVPCTKHRKSLGPTTAPCHPLPTTPSSLPAAPRVPPGPTDGSGSPASKHH